MTEIKGTYSELIELSKQEEPQARKEPMTKHPEPKQDVAVPTAAGEDLATTPYISQNYRFTEDELRWLRRESLNLSEKLGAKVSQNTILRIALQVLRELYAADRKSNPLIESLNKLKK